MNVLLSIFCDLVERVKSRSKYVGQYFVNIFITAPFDMPERF